MDTVLNLIRFAFIGTALGAITVGAFMIHAGLGVMVLGLEALALVQAEVELHV